MFRFLKRYGSQIRRVDGFESSRRSRPHLEQLETRNLLTVFTPSQIQHAYGVDNVINNYGLDGTGEVIAIVIAYDDPYAAADLHTFDAQFGLPDPNFTVAMPQGQPGYSQSWALEAALDVQWAHAMAPGADILLVEARDNSLNNLLGAVNYAKNQPGVAAVSMSWGSGEFSGEGSYNSYFTTPAGHNGVTFLAASGDSGGRTLFPSTSPNVVAVGGTSLILSGGAYSSESGWSGSGGGPSSQLSEPSYQVDFQSSGRRTTPDVSSVANPSTGVYVRFNGGWYQVGGTSASTPQWAGLIALADEGMNWAGFDTLDGPGQTLPALYGIADSDIATYGSYDWVDYHDITTGRAGSYSAGPGYDYVTGLGSPVADGLIPDIISWFTCCGPSGHPGPGTNARPIVSAATSPVNAGDFTTTIASRPILLDDSTVQLLSMSTSQIANSGETLVLPPTESTVPHVNPNPVDEYSAPARGDEQTSYTVRPEAVDQLMVKDLQPDAGDLLRLNG